MRYYRLTGVQMCALPFYGVGEAVVPGPRDDAGGAEEAGRRHVVPADRHAVLEGAEGPATRVEVGGVAGLPAGPDGDAEGHHDQQEEQDDGDGTGVAGHRWPPSISSRSLVDSGSSRRSA